MKADNEIVQEAPEERSVLPVKRDDITTGRDLERRQKVSGLLRPIARPEEVIAAQTETRDLVAKALQKERDYGVIPGTGKKPTLLKPGAERINAAFGVAPRYRIVEREVEHDREVKWQKRKWEWGKERGQKVWTTEDGTSTGLYRYVIECELVHRESGVVIGQGIGSCSTMEGKYVDRPRECENVALKMAQKRALIAATLNAYGLSDQFTQDVEDLDIARDEPVRGDAPPSGKDAAASEKQMGFVEKLASSSRLTDKERDGVRTRILHGMTKKQASDAIEWMQATIKEREEERDPIREEEEFQDGLPFDREPAPSAQASGQ